MKGESSPLGELSYISYHGARSRKAWRLSQGSGMKIGFDLINWSRGEYVEDDINDRMGSLWIVVVSRGPGVSIFIYLTVL